MCQSTAYITNSGIAQELYFRVWVPTTHKAFPRQQWTRAIRLAWQ